MTIMHPYLLGQVENKKASDGANHQRLLENQRDCSRRPEQLDCEPIKTERQGSQCQNKANAKSAD